VTSGGDFLANNSVFAGNISAAFSIFQSSSGQETHAVRLSPQDFKAIGPEELESYRAEWEFESCEIRAMADELANHRILILCGEPELGKTSIAILLAARLQEQRQDVGGASLCRAIDDHMLIDLDGLLGAEPSYHGRTLILKNAFSARNADLKHFAARLAETWSAYQERLERSRSFLILTTETNPAPGSDLERLKLQWNLERPRPDLLTAALRKRAAALKADADAAAKIASWLENLAEACVDRLGTFPRVARFVRDYLTDVAVGRLGFDQAIGRMDDLSRWLLEDLPQDQDAWCTALALTLCCAAPGIGSVSWLQFEQLRRALDCLIRRELRCHHDRRQVADLCRGSTVLERARAEVLDQVRFPTPHLILFRDRRDAARLWQVLLAQGRPLLGLLVPGLLELTTGKEPGLRQCAARALGRIGQVDPLRISLRLMRRWARKQRHELLGPLLQGIVASDDPGYVRGCLGWLDELLEGDPEKAAPTAVASLRELALPAGDQALDRLEKVALARFELQWEPLRKLARDLAEAEASVRAETARRGQADDLLRLAELKPILLDGTIVPEPALRLLSAFQYALNGITWSAPSLDRVFSRLSRWMRDEPARLGPLVALLFLRQGGVAACLRPAGPGAADGAADDSFAAEWLREALTEESAPALCRFLAGVFHQLRSFPGPFRVLLEDSFRSLLASWASASRGDGALRPAMVALLAGLFAAPDPELSETVLRMAKQPITAKQGGDGLRRAKEPRTTMENMADLRELAVEAITSGTPADVAAAAGSAGARGSVGGLSGA